MPGGKACRPRRRLEMTMKKFTGLIVLMTVCVIGAAFAPRPVSAQEFSKTIDVLGFKFTVENGVVEVDNDKLVLKGKGSLDLTPALGAGAVIKVDEMSLDHETTLKLKGITTPEIKLGPFKARIAPDDIVIEKIVEQGINAQLTLNVILDVDLAGKQMEVAAKIPIDKNGLKDATIDFKPAPGKDAFFTQDFNGVVLTLNQGKVTIKNKAFESFTFDGKINLFGVDFDLVEVAVTPDGITGKVAPGEGAALKMGSIGLDLKGGLEFDYNKDGFKVTTGEVQINLATLIPGADGKIIISSLVISNGAFSAEATITQQINIYGVSLNLEHFKLDTEKRGEGLFVKLILDGALGLEQPKMTLKFTGLEIDSDGTVKGEVKVPEAQSFTMFGVGVSINAVKFEVKDGAFSVNTSGEFALGDDKLTFTDLTVAGGKVSAAFDVSKDKPFTFSWFKYLKVNQFGIKDNILTIGGQIDIPDPFKYTFEFADLSFDPAGLPQKLKSATGSDVKAAASSAVQKAWEKVTDPDLVTLENKFDKPLTVAGFSFYIDAITLPNPLKIAKTKTVPDTLLKLYMRSELPLGDQKIYVNVDGLEVTKSGVKDMRLTINPPAGSDSMIKMSFFNWAELKITSAMLVVKNNKVDSFGFTGAVTIEGKGFEVTQFLMKGKDFEGYLRPIGDPTINLGVAKIIIQGDISFKVTSAAAGGTSAGGNAPPSDRGPPGGSFELTIKNLALDMSALFGTSARINADIISIKDGDIHAELSTPNALDIFGLQLAVTKLTLDSTKPADAAAKREFRAVMTGSFTIPSPYIQLTFTNFVVSSTGEFGGDLSLSALQELRLFGVTFTVRNVHIGKLPNEPIEVKLAGGMSFSDAFKVDYTISVKGGQFSASFGISEQNPLALPYCSFIKVTKLEIVNNALVLGGFLAIPDPIGVRLDLTDLTINSRGELSGGVLQLHEAKTINLGLFKLVISSASFDLPTRYFKFSGEIKLPSETFDQSFQFTNIGMSLNDVPGPSSTGSGSRGLDTSNSNIPGKTVQDKKHGFPLTVSNVSFGQKDGKFFLNLNGQLTISVGGYGFQLNFENFKVYQDISFSIGKVTGGIEIAGFKLYISQFEISDTYVLVSGGLALPQIGSIDIEGLKIYKTGGVELERVHVKVDYNAYAFEIDISYKDQIFKGKGSLAFMGKKLTVAAEFGPNRWSVDLDVEGLSVPLFPGIFLDSLGGGITCQYQPFFMEFRIRAGLAIGDHNLLYGRVELVVNTDGIITIRGQLVALTLIPMAEAELTINIPKATVSGWANINQLLYGVVLVKTRVDIYFSPNTWYVKATATADLFAFIRVGNASLYLGSSGFELTFWCGLDLSIVKGEASFYLKISFPDFNVVCKLHASAEIDLVVVSVSGSIDVYLNTTDKIFDGSVHLEACVLKICGSCTLHLRIDSTGTHASW